MATKARKPPTPAQTDKMLKAIDLRYAVTKMADRYATTTREREMAVGATNFDEATYYRLDRRCRWQREALQRLLEAGLSAYKKEAYRL